ncbi:MAG: hypothetical protein WKF43_01540 [Acidimicrobiales bacterium]
MRFQRVEPGGDADHAVDFHRQVTVVQGLTGAARQRFIDALTGIVTGQIDGTAGVIEAQGIEFGIDADTVALLELRSSVDIVLRADELPERNEDVEELSSRLERALALRHEMSGRSEELRLTHATLSAERDTLAREVHGTGPDTGHGSGRVPGDHLAGDRLLGTKAARALALADRWEQLEAQLTAALQTRRGGRLPSNEEVREVALVAARLAVDQARRAREEAEESGEGSGPSAADGEALELAHSALVDLREKAGTLFGGGRARKRLEEAEQREHEILDRLGFASYTEFAISASKSASVALDPASREATVAALADAEAALASCERGVTADHGSAPTPADVSRNKLVAQLAELRREVGEVLGRPPGPFPAAELRAATSLSPRPGATDPAARAAIDVPSVTSERGLGFDVASSDPHLDERSLRLGEVGEAIRALEVRMWMIELEAAAVDDRVVDLDKAMQVAQAAPSPTEEERVAAWEAVEWYVLARMAALRRISVAGSVPFVLDDPFPILARDDKVRLAEGISRMAETVQVVIFSDDVDVEAWAAHAGAHRAGIVSFSGAEEPSR